MKVEMYCVLSSVITLRGEHIHIFVFEVPSEIWLISRRYMHSDRCRLAAVVIQR